MNLNITKNDALIAARTRQANADAALKELRYREKSGELVKREEFEKQVAKEWKEGLLKIRTKVLAVETLAPEICGLCGSTDIAPVAELLRRWGTSTLNEISEGFR